MDRWKKAEKPGNCSEELWKEYVGWKKHRRRINKGGTRSDEHMWEQMRVEKSYSYFFHEVYCNQFQCVQQCTQFGK
jgi:hypothetical protein